MPFERRSSAALFGQRQNPIRVRNEQIRVFTAEGYATLPLRTMPVSPDLQNIIVDGDYYPFSGTYHINDLVSSYTYTSRIVSYSSGEYLRARVVADPTYLQLPPDLPARIRELAEQVTAGHNSPYAKATALETYLRTQYTYGYADDPADYPPPGRDPIDWFLFDHREGTCGVYSSAFVVMARSVGIPARVVSGWSIARESGVQTVYTDQAHQWAEIALSGIGWVEFEPTGSANGPLARIFRDSIISPPPPPPPLDTVTAITQSPAEVRRERPFTVGGTVYTTTGHTVDGMTVEIYVNETKEHGGTKIGTATTRFGRWSAEVSLPRDMERGPYQLLAHAVANDDFEESWSDPDISVFSGTGLELTGPTRVPVDDEAEFSGKLTEETGEGVAGSELEIVVDGTVADTITTQEFRAIQFHAGLSRTPVRTGLR